MGDMHFKNHRMNLTVLLEYFDTSIILLEKLICTMALH